MLNYWFIIYHIQTIIVGQDILKNHSRAEVSFGGDKEKTRKF